MAFTMATAPLRKSGRPARRGPSARYELLDLIKLSLAA
jgi:hypothetical protein